MTIQEESLAPDDKQEAPDGSVNEFEIDESADDFDGAEARFERRKSQLEALLLASTEPITEASFSNAAGKRAGARLKELVQALNQDYLLQQRAFEILPVAGGYLLFTRPEHGDLIRRYLAEKARTRLSRAALESLAVIAFKGPVTRIEIDEIRGVDSGGVLRNLLDRRLIKVKGRAEIVGRPLLYETTDEFLKYFGITSISDLPRHAELTRELGELRSAENHQEGLPLSEHEAEAIDPAHEVGKAGNGHRDLAPQNLSDSSEE